MSTNYNQIILVGRLTKDPELKEISEEISKCFFTLAIDRNYTKADGSKDTDFIPVGLWGKQAMTSFQLLHKGSPVLVAGRLEIESYEKDDVRKWHTEVRGNRYQLLESKKQRELAGLPL